jgi:hypothetical protein
VEGSRQPISLGHRTAVEFAAEAFLGFSLFGDSGDIKDKAEPSQPCLTVYPPTTALRSLPSVALSSGWVGIKIAHLCSERPVP